MKIILTALGPGRWVGGWWGWLRDGGLCWLPWLLCPVVNESYRMETSLHLASDLAPGAGPAEKGVDAVITDGVLLERDSDSEMTRLDRNQFSCQGLSKCFN